MGKFAELVALFLVGCGMAWAKKPVKVERWEAVEELMPGTAINVSTGSQAGPDYCVLAAVDDGTLTCTTERAAAVGRLVFPRSAVRDVWAFEPAPNRHVVLWIAVAVTAGLEITACVVGGAGGGLVIGLMLAAVWAAAATPSWGPVWMPPPPPRQQRWRRRLVYEAPASAVAP